MPHRDVRRWALQASVETWVCRVPRERHLISACSSAVIRGRSPSDDRGLIDTLRAEVVRSSRSAGLEKGTPGRRTDVPRMARQPSDRASTAPMPSSSTRPSRLAAPEGSYAHEEMTGHLRRQDLQGAQCTSDGAGPHPDPDRQGAGSPQQHLPPARSCITASRACQADSGVRRSTSRSKELRADRDAGGAGHCGATRARAASASRERDRSRC